MFPRPIEPTSLRRNEMIAAVWLVVLLVVGCSRQVAVSETASRPVAHDPESLPQWLLGRWEIASAGGGGPLLSIAVDAAQGRSFSGRLTNFMSGDVGLDPARFKRLQGEVQGPLMLVTIDSRDGRTGIHLVFRRVGTELEVVEFALGQEDMLANDRRWLARRVS
jgi:hypothetical protein